MLENYPTLRRVLAILQTIEHASQNVTEEKLDRLADEFNFDLFYLPIAEDELSRLSVPKLHRVCKSERGTVPLKYGTDETLEHIAYAVFNGDDDEFSLDRPAEQWYVYGLFACMLDTETMQSVEHNDVPSEHEDDFADGLDDMRATMRSAREYPSLADAIGAFVAGELRACMADPSQLIVEDGDPPNGKFDFLQFEAHLNGLLSDLVYYCLGAIPDAEATDAGEVTGPVTLVIAPRTGSKHEWPDTEHEWQGCAQGFARLETAQ